MKQVIREYLKMAKLITILNIESLFIKINAVYFYYIKLKNIIRFSLI